MPQVALNWLLQRPTVANVIIGARNEEQLRQNLGAVGWNLTAEQVATLDAASAVHAGLPVLAPARLRGTQSVSHSLIFASRPPELNESRRTPARCLAD